ncbi:hypothetical protein E2C01_063983 [Portunus trituberculatus]|uniref:Ubiquitin-like protease family profile domain-containing protein n=1 Tax=Portunus trituberculatus TaxID=210409 RepID=A0A5B7HF39_PORTR|nr:hypothetical protein [Portunus trituberculatus]
MSLIFTLQWGKNVEAAQGKQKKEYNSRKKKGGKTYEIVVGLEVLLSNQRNEGRKGGKMDPKWTGPYKILDIDSSQCVALETVKTGKKLKQRVSYIQLRPNLRSPLLDARSSAGLKDQAFSIDLKHVVRVPQGSSKASIPEEDRGSSLSITSDSTPLDACGILPKTNKIGRQWFVKQRIGDDTYEEEQHDVYLAPAHGDPGVAAKGITCTGTWLSDEHVDHAQHMLGKNFPSISGFQSTVVFESTKIKSPKLKFIQILNVYGNHWVTVSNIQCNSINEIKIYDSLKSRQLETCEKFNR